MVIVIDDENVSAFGGIMEKVYRFRHALFVDRLKWEECRKPYEREIDQFDGPGCIHLVRMDRDIVTAYSRFLPTMKPHLLSEVYPHIVQRGPAPKGPGIYEWTRCGTLPSRREGRAGIIDPATADIFIAAAETAVARGMEGLDRPDASDPRQPPHVVRLGRRAAWPPDKVSRALHRSRLRAPDAADRDDLPGVLRGFGGTFDRAAEPAEGRA